MPRRCWSAVLAAEQALIASLFFLSALLLVWSGTSKLARPEPTMRAMSGGGLRVLATRSLVRVLGLVELAVGGLCVLIPGPVPAAALALLYLGFAAYLVSLMVRGVTDASCGCFGQADTPPSPFHVLVDLVGVGAAAAAFIAPPPSLWTFRTDLPIWGIPFLLGLATAAYLVVLAEGYLPKLFFSYRRAEVHA